MCHKIFVRYHQLFFMTSSGQQEEQELINPLRAKFFRGNINIYLHFVSFLHIDMAQVVEIFPQVRQEPTYST